MFVEKWRRIESLFNEALEKTADERVGFLDEACSDDRALRHEVESLLAHEDLARGFLESEVAGAPPVTSPRAPVPAGEPIGPYTMGELLGAGGMGEVYKAHDQRLDRHLRVGPDVALGMERGVLSTRRPCEQAASQGLRAQVFGATIARRSASRR